MASYNVPLSGEAMVQKDLPHYNVIFNDLEGVLYAPQLDGKVIAEFSKTFNPSVGMNFGWDSVKINWTRDAPATPMDGFKTTFTLEGILLDGSIDVICETIVNTIPSTETTEDVLFNLKNSQTMSSLSKLTVGTITSGKVQVNLPKRFLYYDSITLECDDPDLSISPDGTPGENDTELLFTLPGGWVDVSPIYLKITEARGTEYTTPELIVSNQDEIVLGPNGVSHCQAMRLKTVIEADNTCNIRFNNEYYAFEV